ncbi:MAG: hypothetical protein M3315_10240 [Actinomycetota bacterium]|nr:hypothetical protein [Actinomycetota bacterium]
MNRRGFFGRRSLGPLYGLWNGKGWMCGPDGYPFHAEDPRVLMMLVETHPAQYQGEVLVCQVGHDGLPVMVPSGNMTVDPKKCSDGLLRYLTDCGRQGVMPACWPPAGA